MKTTMMTTILQVSVDNNVGFHGDGSSFIRRIYLVLMDCPSAILGIVIVPFINPTTPSSSLFVGKQNGIHCMLCVASP